MNVGGTMKTLDEEATAIENVKTYENFDAAPYPFAILLGATTMLLLVSTVRSLWFLVTA